MWRPLPRPARAWSPRGWSYGQRLRLARCIGAVVCPQPKKGGGFGRPIGNEVVHLGEHRLGSERKGGRLADGRELAGRVALFLDAGIEWQRGGGRELAE